MIHLVGLPHTQFDSVNYSTCAFTAKAVRLAKMLRSRGIDTTVYWGGDQADVSLLTCEEQESFFGQWDPAALPSIVWDAREPYWSLFHERAISLISERIGPGDIVGIIGGSTSHEVVGAFINDYTCVEPGVGYEGICTNTFACFESYAWMHNTYGRYGIADGRAFDTVIPNAVDPDDWAIGQSDGYALFVGRLIQRKGPHVAAQIANAAGLKLVVAGGGAQSVTKNKIVCTDGTVIEGDVEYVGAVLGEDRKNLFSHAEVFICPTLYIGPWEGVHAEAMMSGVPVVAPDYGVFTETLPRHHRYRSLSDAVNAVVNPEVSRGHWWRSQALELCGIDKCADMYADWVDRLVSLRDGRNGWYG